MCGPTLIDEQTKQKIAAFNATFRQASTSPFGPDDEIGMLNLMTPDSSRAVLGNADAGKIVDLAVDYFVGMPSWAPAGDPPFQMWMTHTPTGTVVDDAMGVGRTENELVSYSGDAFSMYTHCGTHIDTLNHFGYHGEIFNHFHAHDHLGSRHWRRNGADKHPPVVARGVLFDIPALLGVDMLPPGYGISGTDLDNALRRQGVEFRPGDVALVRTGRMRNWPDPLSYMVDGPGIDLDGARYLAESGAIMIGTDTVGFEQMPPADPDNWQTVHTYLLAEAGVTIMEVVDCETLAGEGIHEFAFIGACVKLRGATGSPIRPLALPFAS
jgi:kynurenine formamidase